MEKLLEVMGLESTMLEIRRKPLQVRISNDNLGKSISITNGIIQFTIPFEPLEGHLRGKSKRKKNGK